MRSFIQFILKRKKEQTVSRSLRSIKYIINIYDVKIHDFVDTLFNVLYIKELYFILALI